MSSCAQPTNVLTAAGVFLCFVGPVNGQTVDPKQIVEQFFPQALLDRAADGGVEVDRDSCFAVYDQLPDGTAKTIMAAYAEGAVRVIELQASGSYTLAFEPTGYNFGGLNCKMNLVDLDADGHNEIHISFGQMRANENADWYFRWDGLQLISMGPTQEEGGELFTLLNVTDLLDIDHDGSLEIISIGGGPIQSDQDGFVPGPPKDVYRLSGGSYIFDRALVYYGLFIREPGQPKPIELPINLSQQSGGQYVLKLVNGKHDGSHRVSSARIVLNGVEILSPEHFSQQVEFLNIPVTLQRHNTIEVTVAGAPLGDVIITIEDTSASSTPSTE